MKGSINVEDVRVETTRWISAKKSDRLVQEVWMK